MKHIVVVSMSAGSGHVRAAQAICAGAKHWHPKTIKTTHIDFKDYIRSPLKRAAIDSYDVIVKQAPEVWGFLYEKSNTEFISGGLKKISTLFEQFNASTFISDLQKLKPDHVIFTHSFPAFTYAYHKHKQHLPNYSVVITDYGLHEFWITDIGANYFVGTKKMKWKLEQKGIPRKNIHISGIPVDPVFYASKSAKINTKKKLKIESKNKVILAMSGGSGLTDITVCIEALYESKEPLQVFAIAGNNKKLLKKLQKLKPPSHISFTPIGWTNEVHKYMLAADFVIGKSGGMTTSECIASQVPLLALDPIPGQEEQNVQFLLEHNLGAIALTKDDILYYIENGKFKKHKSRKLAAKNILEICIK